MQPFSVPCIVPAAGKLIPDLRRLLRVPDERHRSGSDLRCTRHHRRCPRAVLVSGGGSGAGAGAKTDPAAFGELYEAHYSAILNYLYRRTLRVAVAEELTSNTFFKALQGLASYEPREGVRFRSWLYRIATNKARMYWRGRRGGRREVLPLLEGDDLARVSFVWPETESAEAVRERQRQFARVHEALRGLPEPYQAAIVLRYFEGLGHDQIAGILGKRPGTIKSLVHRGLAKLGKAMAGWMQPGEAGGIVAGEEATNHAIHRTHREASFDRAAAELAGRAASGGAQAGTVGPDAAAASDRTRGDARRTGAGGWFSGRSAERGPWMMRRNGSPSRLSRRRRSSSSSHPSVWSCSSGIRVRLPVSRRGPPAWPRRLRRPAWRHPLSRGRRRRRRTGRC